MNALILWLLTIYQHPTLCYKGSSDYGRAQWLHVVGCLWHRILWLFEPIEFNPIPTGWKNYFLPWGGIIGRSLISFTSTKALEMNLALCHESTRENSRMISSKYSPHNWFLGVTSKWEWPSDLLDSVNAILRTHGPSNPSNKELAQKIFYGHEKLPFDSNTNILEATLNYIQASEWFQ